MLPLCCRAWSLALTSEILKPSICCGNSPFGLTSPIVVRFHHGNQASVLACRCCSGRGVSTDGGRSRSSFDHNQFTTQKPKIASANMIHAEHISASESDSLNYYFGISCRPSSSSGKQVHKWSLHYRPSQSGSGWNLPR